MISKEIKVFGQKRFLACDGKCNKAWGVSNRPMVHLSKNLDDFAFLSDDELGEAPEDPGTYEGDCGKPTCEDDRLNKWCYRECERSRTGIDEVPTLRDFSKRIYNIPSSNPEKKLTNISNQEIDSKKCTKCPTCGKSSWYVMKCTCGHYVCQHCTAEPNEFESIYIECPVCGSSILYA